MRKTLALAVMLNGCYLVSPSDGPTCQDADHDGWDSCNDCDDHDAQVHPGVADGGCCGVLNGKDDDCDGEVDEDPSDCLVECVEDADGDGYSPPEDCNDFDASIHPGASDFVDPCLGPGDGIDDDCSGVPDDGPIAGEPEGGCEHDLDHDGYGPIEDCDNRDPAVNPGAWEDVCCRGDGRDNDCDGQVDESVDSDAPCGPCDVDADRDGWASADDCDDSDATRNPGRTEYCCPCGDGGGDADADVDGSAEYPDCNGVDDDCDGLVDETSFVYQSEDEFCCGV